MGDARGPRANFDTMENPSNFFSHQEPTKNLQSDNEMIRWKWISLSQAPIEF